MVPNHTSSNNFIEMIVYYEVSEGKKEGWGKGEVWRFY